MMRENHSAQQPCQIAMQGDSLREAFGRELVRLAPLYDFVVMDADIAGGTGTHHFRSAYPQRFIQCGIAEQNMMGVAAGFATTGVPVFATTFAVFCLRAIEQIRLSIAYTRRNVKVVASHPGLEVGPDGASAQCLEDIAMFRALPHMTVVVPSDPVEVQKATQAILLHQGPVYMRTGRSPCPRVFDETHEFQIGKGQILRQGNDVTLCACGPLLARAFTAADRLAREGVSARVVNLPTIKPMDRELLISCARETGCFVSAEDHNVMGGLGSAMAEVLATEYPCPLEFVGVHDLFGTTGEAEELYEQYGLTAQAIVEAAHRAVQMKTRTL